jgi:uncharacterized protein YeaO (DUF488 family)
MVKTKCVRDAPADSDGERILVTRYWPRGMSREQLRISGRMRPDLAPSVGLLKAWKSGTITWTGYVERYHKEMAVRSAEIAALAAKARGGTITLLCHEREGDPHCHRHLLKEMIVQSMSSA